MEMIFKNEDSIFGPIYETWIENLRQQWVFGHIVWFDLYHPSEASFEFKDNCRLLVDGKT